MPRQQEFAFDAPKGTVMRHKSSVPARQAREFARDGEGFYQDRRLGVRGADRGLTSIQRHTVVRFARDNYKRNGVYGRLLKSTVDFTLGDGIVLTDWEDPEVKVHVERILNDRRNAWDRRLAKRWRETLNEGEYLLTLETDRRNPYDDGPAVPTGVIRFGRFEVDQIDDIKVSTTDPDRIVAVNIKHEDGRVVAYPVIGPGRMPVQDAAPVDGVPVATGGMTAIAYWSIERLAGRGTPLLMRILEKVDLVDEVVDQNLRKGELLNRFFAHGEYNAEGDEKGDENFEGDLLRFIQNPEPGEGFVSSTQRGVKITAMAPKLEMLDQKALFDLVLEFVLGSVGFPRMWFSSSGETNRATAVEQGSPVHRMLISLQAELKGLVEDLVRYLIWIGKKSGRIRADAGKGFTVQMASIATRDAQRDVSVLQQLEALLSSAVRAGDLHPHEKQRIVRGMLEAQTTFEVNLDDEAPEPVSMSELDRVLGDMPGIVREAVKKHLPGHRRRVEGRG